MSCTRICHEVSQPGISQNSGIVERTSQDVQLGTAACLLQAGLPPQFWSFAAPCYSMLNNTDSRLGTSRWHKGIGSEFVGHRFPFGCCVSYLPSPTKDLPRGKWDPVMRVGIFAGYTMRPGWHWCREYYVWDITDFRGFDLSDQTPTFPTHIRHLHVAGRLRLHQNA